MNSIPPCRSLARVVPCVMFTWWRPLSPQLLSLLSNCSRLSPQGRYPTAVCSPTAKHDCETWSFNVSQARIRLRNGWIGAMLRPKGQHPMCLRILDGHGNVTLCGYYCVEEVVCQILFVCPKLQIWRGSLSTCHPFVRHFVLTVCDLRRLPLCNHPVSAGQDDGQ